MQESRLLVVGDARVVVAKSYGHVGGHAREGQPNLTYPQRRSANTCVACPKCEARRVGSIGLLELQRRFPLRGPMAP